VSEIALLALLACHGRVMVDETNEDSVGLDKTSKRESTSASANASASASSDKPWRHVEAQTWPLCYTLREGPVALAYPVRAVEK
jgi:hypothetical protein